MFTESPKLRTDVLQHAAIGSKSTVVERRTKTKVRGQGDGVDDGAGALGGGVTSLVV